MAPGIQELELDEPTKGRSTRKRIAARVAPAARSRRDAAEDVRVDDVRSESCPVIRATRIVFTPSAAGRTRIVFF